MRDAALRLGRTLKQRRFLAPLLVLVAFGAPGLVGIVIGNDMLGGGGIGLLTAALPPALVYAFSGEGPDEQDGGDDGGSGLPPDPPDAPTGGTALDWDAFDHERAGWDRVPTGVG